MNGRRTGGYSYTGHALVDTSLFAFSVERSTHSNQDRSGTQLLLQSEMTREKKRVI